MKTNVVNECSSGSLRFDTRTRVPRISNASNNLTCSTSLSSKRSKRRLRRHNYFDEVFDCLIAEYEKLKMFGDDCSEDFVLDPFLKSSIKQSAYEEFLDELTHAPEYVAITGVMHRLLGVIKMSDDCDLDESVFLRVEDSVCDFIAEKERVRCEVLGMGANFATLD